MTTNNMKCFFEPKSIAVIGASNNPNKFGHIVLLNLIQSEYKGKIYPVNLKEKEIMGHKCYDSVKKIKEDIDLAVVIVPPSISNEVVKECVEEKIPSVIMITAGYKEIGGAGIKREEELIKILKNGNTRLIGPNCLGIWDGYSGVDTMFLPVYKLKRPDAGSIAIISQSGAFGSVILDMASDKKIGISRFISYGNATDISETDLLSYLGKDSKTKAIVAYIEGINNGEKFMRVLKKVSLKKPVVILKSGKSKKGSSAATSHTGSLAGSYEVYKGVMKQCGAIEATNIEQLFDFAKVLSSAPRLYGNNIAVVTNGGGFGVLSTDSIEKNKLDLPNFAGKIKSQLEKIIPSYATAHNPLDLIGDADPERYRKALNIIKKDKNINGILIVSLMQTGPMDSNIIDVLVDFKNSYKKPFVVCLAGGEYVKLHAQTMEDAGISTYEIPARAVGALRALYQYGQWKKE